MDSLKLMAQKVSAGNDTNNEYKLLIKPKTPIEILGSTSTGLKIANFGSEGVYICETEMTIKEIENFNKSRFACRILAVLEVEPND
jgi:hypothetical protein